MVPGLWCHTPGVGVGHRGSLEIGTVWEQWRKVYSQIIY